jgi:hypothetical protein
MGTATGSYPLQDYPVATLEIRRDSSLTVASRFGEEKLPISLQRRGRNGAQGSNARRAAPVGVSAANNTS